MEERGALLRREVDIERDNRGRPLNDVESRGEEGEEEEDEEEELVI
jgi:hypothetical protein